MMILLMGTCGGGCIGEVAAVGSVSTTLFVIQNPIPSKLQQQHRRRRKQQQHEYPSFISNDHHSLQNMIPPSRQRHRQVQVPTARHHERLPFVYTATTTELQLTTTTTTTTTATAADSFDHGTTVRTSMMMTSIDPLVVELFLYNNHMDTTHENDQQQLPTTPEHGVVTESLSTISWGISTWRRALLKGHLPTIPNIPIPVPVVTITDDDVMLYDRVLEQTDLDRNRDCSRWPSDVPLYNAIVQRVMIPYAIPQLVKRHPEMINTVLRVLLSIYMDYCTHHNSSTTRRNENNAQVEQQPEYGLDERLGDCSSDIDVQNDNDAYTVRYHSESIFDVDEKMGQAETFATKIIEDNKYYQEIQKSISIMQSLDQLFDTATTNDLMMSMNSAAVGDSNSSIWHHTGWKILPSLQKQIQTIPKLKQLIKSLGRKSTTKQSKDYKNKYHKFRIRTYDETSPTNSAYIDPIVSPRDYVSGLTRSNRYNEMLPTEAILLLKTSSTTVDTNSSSSRHTMNHPTDIRTDSHNGKNNILRNLFYSKLVESQLLSYEISGWTDVPTRLPNVKQQPQRYHRTPSSRGGPIIICLDTSYSMCDNDKEYISKAIVLACVTAAHQQQRTCRVVAFGPKGTIIDAGESILQANIIGLQNLLNFLSFSFGGGTDVTGALKYAMTVLLSPPDATSRNNATQSLSFDMSAADLLLVTDGEIPDPPVSEQMMEELEEVRMQSDVQIHGILVGRTKADDDGKSIKTLEKICTHVHDFLLDFNINRNQMSSNQPPSRSRTSTTSPLWMKRHSSYPPKTRRQRLQRTVLWGRKLDDDMDAEDMDFVLTQGRSRRSSELDDDDNDNNRRDHSTNNKVPPSTKNRTTRDLHDNENLLVKTNLDEYNSRVEDTVERIQNMVIRQLKEDEWTTSLLDEERQSSGSCWMYQDQLRAAIHRVGENLIERDIEARLVVLGMITGEHVLFIGPPGTAKSALGHRLSEMCGGAFFQRLLTRFTTPEEIFGPLSLRALENDEYKRCTDGFLPKASVAFLDEIFKANSAILNTLLTILNERQFDNGAGNREDCPIRCVIAASNELPESDELDALYDRFLLRKEVLPVSDDGIVQLLTTISTPDISPCDSGTQFLSEDSAVNCDIIFAGGLDRVVKALSIAADQVKFDIDTSYLLRDLRTYLREEMNVNISDRRLVKVARLLKVSAATHGRTRVDPIDCLLLQHVAWNTPEQREMIYEWLFEHITPGSTYGGEYKTTQYNLLLNGLRQTAMTAVRRMTGDLTGKYGAKDSDVTVLTSIRMETSQLVSLLQMESDMLSRHIELLRQSVSHLWFDRDEAVTMQQQLIPIAERAWKSNFFTLKSARALEVVLTCSSSDSDPKSASVSDDIRLSVMEQLWNDDEMVFGAVDPFTENELNLSMKEAKSKYINNGDTFRRWKRERKKAGFK